MIYLFIIAVILAIQNMVREVLFMKERKQLVDRIQSKDLVEYKKFEEAPKPKQDKKEEKEYIDYL